MSPHPEILFLKIQCLHTGNLLFEKFNVHTPESYFLQFQCPHTWDLIFLKIQCPHTGNSFLEKFNVPTPGNSFLENSMSTHRKVISCNFNVPTHLGFNFLKIQCPHTQKFCSWKYVKSRQKRVISVRFWLWNLSRKKLGDPFMWCALGSACIVR